MQHSSSATIQALRNRLIIPSDEPELRLLECILDLQKQPHTLDEVLQALRSLDDDQQSELLRSAPLSAVPPLLVHVRTNDDERDAALGILSLIGARGSAKEIVMVVQESLEHIEHDYEQIAESGVQEEKEMVAGLGREWIALVQLASQCVPRLVRRKLSPFEMLRPVLSAISSSSDQILHAAQREESLDMLQAVLGFVRGCRAWIALLQIPDPDRQECLLHISRYTFALLSSTLDRVQSSIAERYFERLQPRYVVPGRSFVKDGWETGQKMYESVVTSLELDFELPARVVYECDVQNVQSVDSALGAMAVLVHCFQDKLDVLDIRLAIVKSSPVVLRALHGSHAIGVILAWLWSMSVLARDQKISLDQEDIVPIIQSVMPISAMSPDSSIRFIAFRLLDVLFSLISPLAQLSILRQFMSAECPFPQMRVAAVGLVKSSVLAALREKATSPFNSAILMQTIGPILLRPQPSDLFDKKLPLSEFVDSYEPPRLIECMTFVYVLLQVDKQNRTAIRDAMPEFRQRLLNPIRERLKEWEPEMEKETEVSMALSGLIMSVERFDSLS